VSAAFYCVADSRYFLGAVGAINSLRLLGHDEPVYLLDCGLTREERELLAPEATLVEAPVDAAPTMLKTILPLAHPADIAVFLDTDVILTRSAAELISEAGRDRVVGFRNDMDRHEPGWGEALDLGVLERRPYLSFALVCIGGDARAAVLDPLAKLQAKVDVERTMWGSDDPGYPLRYADQDVLNAVVAARVPAERVRVLPTALLPVPPFRNLRVTDPESLRCAYPDGTEPYGVHHFLTKPWLERTHEGVYSELLRRLLVGEGIAIRVPQGKIPRRFRRGSVARAERAAINVRERVRGTGS
jgi:hypothetical protein